jgi:transcriptional regulator with XRE-family HTH domain
MKFGEFVKSHRMKTGMTLREFCKKNSYDPSNWSKTERGLLQPPNDEDTLSQWANSLGIEKNSGEWYALFDMAYTEKGRIPKDILSDEELIGKMPLFFRTLRGQKPNEDEIKALFNILRREL